MNAALEILLVLVLAAHLLAVGAAVAGPFVGFWLDLREARGDSAAGVVGRLLLKWSLWLLGAGVLLGVVAGLMQWRMHTPGFLEAVGALPTRRYMFGIAEVLFSAACVVVALWLWKPAGAATRRAPLWRRLILLLGATNLAYHFPTLFAGIAVMSGRPGAFKGEVRFLDLLLHPETLARTTHFGLTSLTITGLLVMWLAGERVDEPADAARVRKKGARLSLASTMLQWLVGAWVLLQLPTTARTALMGEDAMATLLFLAGLTAVAVLTHSLMNLAGGGELAGDFRKTVVLLTVVVCLMVGMRQRARHCAHAQANRTAAVAADENSTLWNHRR